MPVSRHPRCPPAGSCCSRRPRSPRPRAPAACCSSAVPMLGSARLDRLRRAVAARAKGLYRRRHVPARLGRLRRGQRVRQRQQHTAGVLAARREYLAYLAEVRGHHPRRRGSPARGGALGLPRPGGPAPHRCRGATRVWERTVCRRRLPPGPGRDDLPAAVPHPRAARDPADGPARPGRGVGPAPPALHPPRAAGPARSAVAACVRARRGHRRRRARPVRLARAMVLPAATQHAPDQLVVAAIVSREALPEWEWVKWLPHAPSPRERDGVGPARMVGDVGAPTSSRCCPQDVASGPGSGRVDQRVAAARAHRRRRR